jgi:hypothetical protein
MFDAQPEARSKASYSTWRLGRARLRRPLGRRRGCRCAQALDHMKHSRKSQDPPAKENGHRPEEDQMDHWHVTSGDLSYRRNFHRLALMVELKAGCDVQAGAGTRAVGFACSWVVGSPPPRLRSPVRREGSAPQHPCHQDLPHRLARLRIGACLTQHLVAVAAGRMNPSDCRRASRSLLGHCRAQLRHQLWARWVEDAFSCPISGCGKRRSEFCAGARAGVQGVSH